MNDATPHPGTPTTAEELNRILIEEFGAVPLNDILTKPGMTIKLAEVEE